jgi:mono/diheme cytochrome c family protein
VPTTSRTPEDSRGRAELKPICVAPGAILAGIFVVIFSAPAARAADADNGLRLAQRWCATCHLVTPDQQTASADAAPFATIAKTPGFSAERLAFFLLEPHPKMPDMALTRREAEDLAAYIGKLAK